MKTLLQIGHRMRVLASRETQFLIGVSAQRWLKLILCASWAMVVCSVYGAPLTEREALARFTGWAEGHPIMAVAASRPVKYLTEFPDDTADYRIYVIAFEPQGYAVLSGDGRLPLVVAYSPTSTVNLADQPDNIFRQMLQLQADLATARLADMPADAPVRLQTLQEPVAEPLSVEQYGPYIETSWNQCHPYNLLCPEDPGGTEYYGFRVPTGCTPTAYAQVMHFHRWPLRGWSSHSYTDSAGSITGYHEADFTKDFGWSAMQPSYEAFTAIQPGDEEVADLMYRLGVAADADFESSGTSSSIRTLGQRLGTHLYYETVTYHASSSALLPELDTDLQAGFPAVVSIPGHTIVADGLLVNGADRAYHINYGWGGKNNGWWAADNVAGSPISGGCTAIRPRLMPMPLETAVTGIVGEPSELKWLLPKRREQEAQRLRIRELTLQDGNWTNAGESLDHTVSHAWESRAEGRTGNCWYAGPNGYGALTLTDRFVPTAGTNLNFWMKYRLGSATLNVSVSANGGQTFDILASYNDNYTLSWQSYTLSLAAYAGQSILLRFELTSGSYYSSGGVWLDDLSLSAGAWYRWVDFAEDTDLASRRFSEERTLLDPANDFSVFELTSTSAYKDWAIAATEDGGSCFYKEPGGYGNRKYHLTARNSITPEANTRLVLRWKRLLYADQFRVLVSTDRTNFAEIWSAHGQSGWVEQAISLADYAGQSIYVRLEYVVGSYYSSGGVWIDYLHLQTVTHPDLEGQPEHYTTLTGLTAGSYNLAALVIDQDGTLHSLGPAFTLEVYPLYETADAEGGIVITAYHGTASHVVVPNQIEGRPVVGLAATAFTHPGLTSVVLPASLVDIAAESFVSGVTPQRIYFLGDAPAVASGALTVTGATLYYQLGTAGWGAALDGRPTVQWTAVLSLPFAGITPEGLTLHISGPPDHTALIETTSDLITADWAPTATRVLTSGTASFTDPASLNASRRFYRVLIPPLE